MEEKIIIKSEKDTEKLANKIASTLKGGEIIALQGELGAGKTTFTQYLAKALGVKTHVNSPTFVLMKIYETDKHPLRYLVHMDAYRIASIDEVEYLGIDRHIQETNSVVVIEWAENIKEYLKKYKLIEINMEMRDNVREVSINM